MNILNVNIACLICWRRENTEKHSSILKRWLLIPRRNWRCSKFAYSNSSFSSFDVIASRNCPTNFPSSDPLTSCRVTSDWRKSVLMIAVSRSRGICSSTYRLIQNRVELSWSQVKSSQKCGSFICSFYIKQLASRSLEKCVNVGIRSLSNVQ